MTSMINTNAFLEGGEGDAGAGSGSKTEGYVKSLLYMLVVLVVSLPVPTTL